MTIPFLLHGYISRQFLLHFIYLLGILLGVVFLFDLIELIRRASNYEDTGLGILFQMALLKLPEVGQMLFPFAVLFSAIFTFWRLARTQELVIIRSTGLSVWQFLLPLLTSAFLIGIFAIIIINPLSAALLTKYEMMEMKYLGTQNNIIAISKTGLWLRQQEPDQGNYALIHARSFQPHKWTLNNVIVFFLDKNGELQQRLDAESAQLTKDQWQFQNVILHQKDPIPQKMETYQLKTGLTAKEIEDSFAPPETLPFWKIPEFIRVMAETGFSTARLHVHLQALLSKPFLFAAMILLAAIVSLRPQRQGGVTFLIVTGVGIGFFIFFMESILHAFGISQKIPPVLAAWTPASVSLLLGAAFLLYLEDG